MSCLPLDQLPERGDPAWREPHEGALPFVVEVRSRGQRLADQQRKLERYLANGVQLGWLFDPVRRQVHLYRPGREPEILTDPPSLSGEDILAGLTVDLTENWP